MIELRVLGPVGAQRSGSDLALPGRRSALLARLAIERGRSVSRERLIADLWGDDAIPSAVNGVQVVVSQLRRTLGDEAIVTTPAGYAIGSPVATDLARFADGLRTAEARVRQEDDLAAAAAFVLALDEWRGEALQGVTAPFVAADRRALEEERLRAVTRLADVRMRLGAFAAAVDDLAPLVAAHPLREELVAAQVLALAAGGRRLEALALVDATRLRLAEEYGVDVGTALAEAHRRVLRDELPTASPTAGSVPMRTGVRRLTAPMIGRDDDLARLLALLAEPDVRLVTVVGTAGVGKTRLAEAVVERYGDRAAVASLVGAQAAGDIAAVVAQELDVPVAAVDPDPIEALVDALQTADALEVLVLDNLEHLPGAAAVVEGLLTRLPRLTVLATSREPMRIAGEHRLPVRPLPRPADLDGASARIFLRSARRVDPEFAVPAGQMPDLQEVLAGCEGLPLALELAAGWLDLIPIAELRSRLVDRLGVLVDPHAADTTRSNSMRASIEWSVGRLPAEVRSTLLAAAVFAGGFTLPAVASVAGIDRDLVDRHLAVLVDRSLVLRSDRTHGRFELLHVIREVLLDGVDPRTAVRLRRAHLALVHAPLAHVPRSRVYPSSQQDFAALRTEQSNIRAAVRFAAEHDLPRLVDLLATISTGWVVIGFESELVGWCRSTLDRTDLTPEQRFDVLLAAERAVGLFGGLRSRELQAAAARLRASVGRDRELALRVREAWARFYTGELDDASARTAALRATLDEDDEAELGILVDELDAVISVERGATDGGVAALRGVLARARQADLELHARTIATNLVEALLSLGRGAEAERLGLQILAEAPSDAMYVRSNTTSMIGLAQFLQGRYDRAAVTLRLALRLMRGRTMDSVRLTVILAFATGLPEPLDIEERALLAAGWHAARRAEGVVPTMLERRMLELVPPVTDEDVAAAVEWAGGAPSGLADALTRRLLDAPAGVAVPSG